MKTYDAKDIRNVLLVGHGGSGKTTLLESMLFTAGALTRMGTVEDGNTVSDHDPDEQRRQISVSLAMAPIEWKDTKINVLDAPGTADFVGDVRSAVRAADAVILVVSAVDGVEVQTEYAWELAVQENLPRAIFGNKLYRERADFQATLEQLVSSFGNQVAPFVSAKANSRRDRGVSMRNVSSSGVARNRTASSSVSSKNAVQTRISRYVVAGAVHSSSAKT